MKRSMSLTIVTVLSMFFVVFPGNSVEMDDLVFYFPLDEGQGDKIKGLSPDNARKNRKESQMDRRQGRE